jgi:allantoinase
MTYDLLIRGGDAGGGAGAQPDIAVADGVIAAQPDIAVADGVIAAIGPALAGAAREELDAAGLLVLPGVVDAHVHLNDPGRAHWEGFATGTAALAAGGTTCAVDMPLNALPPTLDGAAFDAKVRAAAGRLHVDVALWGGLVPGDLDRLDELAARGVVGFKAFMSASGVPEFPAADDATLFEGMCRAARLGLPVAVHAESDAITAALAARAAAEGRLGVRDYLASRPVAAEAEAIGRALALAEVAGCALHVVHVSTARGVALVAEARARGVDATCEACPHHLVLDAEDAKRLGAIAKCAPPLRPAREVAALRGAVERGDVDWIATDHSPAPADLKQGDDAFAWWGGIAGAQTLLALAFDLFAAHDPGGAGADSVGVRLAELLAAGPARRLRLAKGTLEVGADADLVLLDPAGGWTVAREDLLDRHKLSPFAGRRLRGRVVRTILRGRTVAVDGRIAGEPAGRIVHPSG